MDEVCIVLRNVPGSMNQYNCRLDVWMHNADRSIRNISLDQGRFLARSSHSEGEFARREEISKRDFKSGGGKGLWGYPDQGPIHRYLYPDEKPLSKRKVWRNQPRQKSRTANSELSRITHNGAHGQTTFLISEVVSCSENEVVDLLLQLLAEGGATNAGVRCMHARMRRTNGLSCIAFAALLEKWRIRLQMPKEPEWARRQRWNLHTVSHV